MYTSVITSPAALLLLSLSGMMAVLSQHLPTTPPTRPNVILLLADDLGWGDVGCFGNSTLRTPNIDRLAREGALLTHALSAASVCTPSRAALFTGRYPLRSGMTTSGITRVIPFLAARGGLPPDEITFAQLALQNGYRTAHVGKWHLGLHCGPTRDFCHHPFNHGYQHFYGLPWSNARDLGSGSHHGLSIDALDARIRPGILTASATLAVTSLFWWWWSKQLSGKNRTPTRLFALVVGLTLSVLLLVVWGVVSHLGRLNGVLLRGLDVVEQPVQLEGIHERFLSEATAFLRSDGGDSPFLLTVAFTHAHTALEPTRSFRGRSAHGLYGDIVEELDWTVGQLLDELDRLGMAENTFVAFTSDQGAHAEEVGWDGLRHGGHNGPFRGGKGIASMEGGIRVPTLVRWPRHVPAGFRVNHPVSLMDFFPTVAAVIGASLPADLQLDGRNMLPLLMDSRASEESKPEPRLLVHYCGTVIHAARLVQDDEHVWKLVLATPHFISNTTRCHFLCPCRGQGVNWHHPPLLYNVADDLAENSPISEDSLLYKLVVPKVMTELNEHLEGLKTISPPNQLEFPNNLWLPWLQPCCNFPFCNCQEKNGQSSSKENT